MQKIHFTSALSRFFPELKTTELEARNVREVVDGIELTYPGIKSFLLEDDGSLRKHVNIFIGDELGTIDSDLHPDDEIFIFQALSGG